MRKLVVVLVVVVVLSGCSGMQKREPAYKQARGLDRLRLIIEDHRKW